MVRGTPLKGWGMKVGKIKNLPIKDAATKKTITNEPTVIEITPDNFVPIVLIYLQEVYQVDTKLLQSIIEYIQNEILHKDDFDYLIEGILELTRSQRNLNISNKNTKLYLVIELREISWTFLASLLYILQHIGNKVIQEFHKRNKNSIFSPTLSKKKKIKFLEKKIADFEDMLSYLNTKLITLKDNRFNLEQLQEQIKILREHIELAIPQNLPKKLTYEDFERDLRNIFQAPQMEVRTFLSLLKQIIGNSPKNPIHQSEIIGSAIFINNILEQFK